MKRDISYKNLILGSAVYILGGLIIKYLVGVWGVLSERAIAEGKIDPPLLFGDNFLLYLFLICGGYTFTFYAIFFYIIRKRNFFKNRTFIISFLAIFINYFVGYAIAVDDNIIPYINYFTTIDGDIDVVIRVTFFNYIVLLVILGAIYLFSTKVKGECHEK